VVVTGIRVVENTIGDLADDLASIARNAQPRLSGVVRRNVNVGLREAKRLARRKAGPHGENYYKRLSGEMTGLLEGEYGPEGDPKTDFVGVGFRHGLNTDLPNSADVVGPKFLKDVGDELDRWFW
jgi:hypothetical protein